MKNLGKINITLSWEFKEQFSAKRLSETPRTHKKFSHALCHEIKGILKPYLFEAANAIIQTLNRMNHDLSLDEEEDSDYLYVRYLHRRDDDDYDFLVAFDLSISVFFVKNAPNEYLIGNEVPQSRFIELTFDDRFSRFSFDQVKNEQLTLKQRCNELQTAIEARMYKDLMPAINSIIHGLNELGHSLIDLKSDVPEIDFRDMNTGLHIGFYCIATVDYRRPPF